MFSRSADEVTARRLSEVSQCESQTLPSIEPTSKANAVKCQNCGAIVERKDLEKK